MWKIIEGEINRIGEKRRENNDNETFLKIIAATVFITT
jgi:hypothetical protein